jgi:predicted DNA-binding WGR domain protein
MTSLHILLEARSAARRCWRAYEIDVGTDLFGACLVEMSYGRIGAMGRSRVPSFATAAAAQAEVHVCLRKRAAAPRRIGSRIVCGVPASPGIGHCQTSKIG